MLEEAFSNANVPPAEAALALLSFVRYDLPAGGSAAEARFLRLFPLLCQRLFGPLQTTGEFRYEPGGWLSQQIRWNRPASASPTSPSSRISSTIHSSKEKSLDYDPVVQLLGGRCASSVNREQLPTLIDAISRETEHRPGVRFSFPFQALPKPTQDVMLAMIKSAFGGIPMDVPLRDNATRLCGVILRVHPKDQNELILFQQKLAQQKQEQQRPLQLSPGMARSPVSSSSPKESKPDITPKIMLSMLEYYLFNFVRFPLAIFVPPPKYPQPQGMPSGSPSVNRAGSQRAISPGSGSGIYRKTPALSYGKQVYDHLFRGYLRHFLPHGKGRPPFLGFMGLDRESELFLRIMIEFWLDGENIFPKTMDAAKAIRERRHRMGGGSDTPLNLDSSFDMIQIKNYTSPPSLVQSCIRNLVNRVVSDPCISLAVADSYETLLGRRSSASQADASSAATAMLSRGNNWCLSPSMTILQQSFYNYVRTTFRHAPIHMADSPFYTAMNAWLVWLEPWNVQMRKTKPSVSNLSTSNAKQFLDSMTPGIRGGSDVIPVVTIPKATTRSQYSQKWEPYIAANLHLYTVPLATYLRRARELDFSSREFHRSMKFVQRVFRVFSPDVVDAINRLLAAPPTTHSLVSRHIEILGEFSPSLMGQLSLSSCSKDMHTLLEEVYMQHMKTVQDLDFLDRIASRVEDLFYQGTTSDESAIKSLICQAKTIVDFPVDFIDTSKKRSYYGERSVGAGESMAPDRSKSGLLTQHGREQVVMGTVKSSPMDIAYIGDKMTSRPNTYEIPLLVKWTICLSNWLNCKLGLGKKVRDGSDQQTEGSGGVMARFLEGEESQKQWFRINLRFMADYRNIIFIGFVSWLVTYLVKIL